MGILTKSKVIFDQINHRYFLGQKELRGITGMLGNQLFPNKYMGIPQEVLAHAAERGTRIHIACELVDSIGIEPNCQEAKNYVRLKEQNNLVTLANEYLVSDHENFATSIDVVFTDFSIGDIKTTYKLDEEYLSWQLSINAYLFELQNPGISVNKLYAIWLRDDNYKLVEIPRKSDEEVIALMRCEVNGERYISDSIVIGTSAVPASVMEIEGMMISLELQLKELQDKRASIMERLYEEMQKAGIEKWETENMRITRKKPTVKESFDTKAFKADHPDLYEKYVKSSPVKGSILFKVL